MRDFLFFPLAALAMALMVWAGVAEGPARLREALAPFSDPYAGLRVEGEVLGLFQAPDGLSVDPIALESGEPAVRMAAFRPIDQPPLSQGIFITLAPEFSAALAGHTVRISVRIRSATETGTPRFAVSYFGGDGRNSGWLAAPLSRAWRTYEFDFALPPGPPAGENVDYVGLWPDPEGRGRMLDLVSLTVRILGEDEPPPPPAVLRGDP